MTILIIMQCIDKAEKSHCLSWHDVNVISNGILRSDPFNDLMLMLLHGQLTIFLKKILCV